MRVKDPLTVINRVIIRRNSRLVLSRRFAKFPTKLSVSRERKSRLTQRETVCATSFHLSSTTKGTRLLYQFHKIEFTRNNEVTVRVSRTMCKYISFAVPRSFVHLFIRFS